MSYIVKQIDGEGFSLNSGKTAATVRRAVFFEGDDREVWSTQSWFAPGPRNLAAQAGKTRLAYQRHFERTGQRFELKLWAERDAKRAEKERAQALAKSTREAAPDLLAAAKAVLAQVEGGNPYVTPIIVEQLILAINKAEGK